MEFVEGSTLADRIARGPLAVSEALPVACQIAEALEAAHEKGIVHRDLKPANIKITPDSIVKVLDFGLAKAIRPPEDAPELRHSPAFTMGCTKDGVLLGTAAYMSPEQVRGQAVDNRADIWAFGCVLYEMLSGRRAFQGDEVSDILAGILRDDPAWDALPRFDAAVRPPAGAPLPRQGPARAASSHWGCASRDQRGIDTADRR